jgi:hypothetical protein
VVKVVEKIKVLVEAGRRPSGTRALFSYLFCFCYLLSELDGTDVAKGAVRVDVVILPTPVTDNQSCFGQSPQLFAVKIPLTEASMEALDVSVLPRTARFDIQSLDSLTR